MLKSKTSKIGSLLISHWATDGYTVVLAPILVLIAIEFNLSILETATIISAYTIAAAVFQMPVAFFSDYTGRAKEILAVGLFISGLGLVGYGVSANHMLLVIFAFLLGVGFSGYHPVSMNLMTQMFEERKGFSLGFHTVAGSLGASMMPIFIGLFGDNWRIGTWILAVPAFVTGAWIMLAFDNVPFTKKKDKFAISIIKETGANPVLLLVALLGGIFQISYWGAITFIPLFFINYYGWSVAAAAALLGAFHFSAIVSQPVIGYLSDILNRNMLLLVLGLLIGIACILLYLVDNPVAASIFTVILGAALLALRPINNAKAADISSPATRSMAIGIVFTFSSAVGAVAPILGAYMEKLFSYQAVFLVYGLITFLGLGVLYLMVQQEKALFKKVNSELNI